MSTASKGFNHRKIFTVSRNTVDSASFGRGVACCNPQAYQDVRLQLEDKAEEMIAIIETALSAAGDSPMLHAFRLEHLKELIVFLAEAEWVDATLRESYRRYANSYPEEVEHDV